MTTAQTKSAARIDSLMEQASVALVERRYFDCEEACEAALLRAALSRDFDRMARILMPLQECRRQIRDEAFDTRRVYLITGEVPTGKAIRGGCYLLAPPRVGVDGRILRENAAKKRVPVIVIVREPTTRDGQCPIVAVGPVTVRTKVEPPHDTLPEPEWFLRAAEALGDAAIAQCEHIADPAARANALLERLAAVPDHEKLHQRLAEACREALHMADPPRRRARVSSAVSEE